MGSGNTGVASSLMVIGGIYAATILASSLIIRKPAPGYCPPGGDGSNPASAACRIDQNVDTNTVMKTPQVIYTIFLSSVDRNSAILLRSSVAITHSAFIKYICRERY